MDIPELIKTKRKHAGFTQESAAKVAGVSRSHWSNYETGDRVPLPGNVPELAKILCLTPAERDAVARFAIAEHGDDETKRLILSLERKVLDQRKEFARVAQELRRKGFDIPEHLLA
jgi:transcriptional regulator with XRE-family HTH domain